jgi:hypothetical protein
MLSARAAERARRRQIYKLADDFTFSGSEETFSQLQAMLEGLEARTAPPPPPPPPPRSVALPPSTR